MYDRLRTYLTTLGLYDGETPHSLRVGCALTLSRSGVVSAQKAQDYIGWKTPEVAERYTRSKTFGVNPVGVMLANYMGRESLVSPGEVQNSLHDDFDCLATV